MSFLHAHCPFFNRSGCFTLLILCQGSLNQWNSLKSCCDCSGNILFIFTPDDTYYSLTPLSGVGFTYAVQQVQRRPYPCYPHRPTASSDSNRGWHLRLLTQRPSFPTQRQCWYTQLPCHLRPDLSWRYSSDYCLSQLRQHGYATVSRFRRRAELVKWGLTFSLHQAIFNHQVLILLIFQIEARAAPAMSTFFTLAPRQKDNLLLRD